MSTGTGGATTEELLPAGPATEAVRDGAEAPGVFCAAASAAFCAAIVADAAAKSAEVNVRPASSGMCMVEKKLSPTVSSAVLTFDFGGAPSRCTSSPDQPPLKRASSE